MKQYYKFSINKKALPWMFQIMQFGYQKPNHTIFASARAVFTIGYNKRNKKFVFKIRKAAK